MTVVELELPLRSGNIAARAWGDPRNKPMLAIHGWLDNAASFDRLAPLLGDHYVVAIDLPGHGRSAHRPPGDWYHSIDYLDDVLAVADALGWLRFRLLGHSLGGGIASLLAAACPERVDRLLLIEALGPNVTDAEQSLAQLQRALRQRAELVNKSLRVFPSLLDAVAARQQASSLSSAAAQVLVERGTRAVDGGYSWSSDPRLTAASPMRYSETQALNLLGGIRAPTFVILAEPDAPYLKRQTMQVRIAAVADIELKRMPGNHHLHLEDAAPMALAMQEFLARRAQ
jgi:pimeloyl-ACP methyl ester carboxylesterase